MGRGRGRFILPTAESKEFKTIFFYLATITATLHSSQLDLFSARNLVGLKFGQRQLQHTMFQLASNALI